MRELFDIDRAMAELERAEADPVGRARKLNRRELPKRFYTAVTLAPAEGGVTVLLDGRPVRTPAKRPLVLPTPDLAETSAAEWAGQGEFIDPATMPMTRLANSVIDGVADRRAEVAADASKYAATDLLCYRADNPDRLVLRQTTDWDPLLDWVEERFGARFIVTEGIRPVAQDPDALRPLAERVAALDPWTLAGLHQMTTIGGSLIAALAVLEGRLDPITAFDVVTLDERWSLEVWGADEEAEAKLAHRRADFLIAARVIGKVAPLRS
jgi:chaperone required for assembly of F1-ATPase